MTAGVRGGDPGTGLTAPAGGPAAHDVLSVQGALPAGLDGCFLLSGAHPVTAARSGGGAVAGPHVFSGIRLGGGEAWWLRAELPVRRDDPLGPVPALAPSLWFADRRPSGGEGPGPAAFARPVREAGGTHWHTIATYPGLDQAEHLVAAPDGAIVRAEPFSLPGAPLMQAVGLTRRYVVVLDLPVVHSRAAELIGARLPYVWKPGRPARIGLLPRDAQGAEPRWTQIEPCYVPHVVNAYDDGDQVVLDGVSRARAFSSPEEPDRPHLRRWVLDAATGSVTTRRLVDGLETAVLDERASGRAGRFVFGTANSADGPRIVVHDLATGLSGEHALRPGLRVGRPVFAPDPHCAQEGAGWLVVPVQDAARRCGELRVFDALAVGGPPRAVVRLPVAPPAGWRTAWCAASVPETVTG
ncbi:carotenoid oxygenase family protein [Spirillospora sp. NBC_01491]|uniref:carotenoid oxygenase family protein n=1 Tax=Spirillospora sp. NBC_01491 TaxID=2976007 RepID=UPI002E37FC1A|nr:carotenoid oxygenase family protein [Spirillospora sp. NBC_01491]